MKTYSIKMTLLEKKIFTVHAITEKEKSNIENWYTGTSNGIIRFNSENGIIAIRQDRVITIEYIPE